MKKLLLIFTVILSPYFLNAQNVAIPDDNFENYLETHNADGGEVLLGDPASMGDGVLNNDLTLKSNLLD